MAALLLVYEALVVAGNACNLFNSINYPYQITIAGAETQCVIWKKNRGYVIAQYVVSRNTPFNGRTNLSVFKCILSD